MARRYLKIPLSAPAVCVRVRLCVCVQPQQVNVAACECEHFFGGHVVFYTFFAED